MKKKMVYNKKNIDEEYIEKLMVKYNYYTDDKTLIRRTLKNVIKFIKEQKSTGQDETTILLEGPPGCGKSSYAYLQKQILEEILNEEVIFLEYSCNRETTQNQLIEDINVTAVCSSDTSKVNIAGYLTQAFFEVNKGKYVILFLDEWDKGPEELDDYLLTPLQKGKLNTTQHGEINIKPEYKSHLLIFLGKNMKRSTLSEQLIRRCIVHRLKIMSPSVFYQVAMRNLGGKVNKAYIDLVSILYQIVYDDPECVKRIPSCAELLIAIEEADLTDNYCNDVTKSEILDEILSILFKDENSYKSFVEEAQNYHDDKIKNLFLELVSYKKLSDNNISTDIGTIIAQNLLTDYEQSLLYKERELDSLIKQCEEQLNASDKGQDTPSANNSYTSIDGYPFIDASYQTPLANFNDDTIYVHRGVRIEELSSQLVEIAVFKSNTIKNGYFLETLKNNAAKTKTHVYEDGFCILHDDDTIVTMIRRIDKDNNLYFIFHSNQTINSISHINAATKFIDYITTIAEQKLKLNNISKQIDFEVFISCLVNDGTPEMTVVDPNDNTSLFEYQGNLNDFHTFLNNIPENNKNHISKKIKTK